MVSILNSVKAKITNEFGDLEYLELLNSVCEKYAYGELIPEMKKCLDVKYSTCQMNIIIYYSFGLSAVKNPSTFVYCPKITISVENILQKIDSSLILSVIDDIIKYMELNFDKKEVLIRQRMFDAIEYNITKETQAHLIRVENLKTLLK